MSTGENNTNRKPTAEAVLLADCITKLTTLRALVTTLHNTSSEQQLLGQSKDENYPVV